MFLISKILNKTKLDWNKEVLKILLVHLVLTDADLLLIGMNTFQLWFRFHHELCPVLPAVLIISWGECILEKFHHFTLTDSLTIKQKKISGGKFRV